MKCKSANINYYIQVVLIIVSAELPLGFPYVS